jgi:hypothetical protein
MNKRVRLIWMLLGFLFALPGMARAGIIEWIDQMSGPGPFLGFSVEARLHCYPAKRTDDIFDDGKPRPKDPSTAQQDYEHAIGVVLPCLNRLKPGERPGITVNLASGVSWALHNNLPYASDVQDTGVRLTTLEPSFWWYPLPPVAVGAAAGVYWFKGAGDTFSRFFIKPVQVELKPFAFPRHRWHTAAQIFTIRASYVLMPEGVEAKDFGAIGPFKTEHEVLPSVAVLLDLGHMESKYLNWFH